MRTTKELLIILRRRLRKEEGFDTGLCWVNSMCCVDELISYEEMLILSNYIEENKPVYRLSGWGWKPGVKAPRDRWLTRKINEL